MSDAPQDPRVGRLLRKIEKRDQRIAGLERRVATLEHSLALRSSDAVVVDSATLRRDLKKAVQDALCNVRLIPVLGVGKGERIVEVRSTEGPR